jgi:hypothetical protein
MQQTSILIAVVTALSTSNAMATEPGAYAGVGIGLATVTDSLGNSGISSNNNVGANFDDLGLGFVGGYNINRYIGLEVGVNALGVFGWSYASGGIVTALPASFEVVGYIPLYKGLDIFGKYGTSYTRLDFTKAGVTSVSDKTQMYGLGIEFSLSDKSSYRFGVDHHDLSVLPGTSVSANYFNLTGIMRF